MDIFLIRQAVKKDNFEWKKHTLARLAERNISQADVVRVILEGEVIEEYPQDKPFSSCLMFRIIENKPLHIVVSLDQEHEKVYIITVYQPSLDKFEPDFKTRRK